MTAPTAQRQAKQRIAVIGGGAAGFFSAISAATAQPNSEVTIFEGSGNLLSKVLISGGGRCNVTNNSPDPRDLIKGYPRGNKALRSAFSQFAVNDTIDWFKSHGVALHAEADNRMFPTTNNSQTVADCLIRAARDLQINILLRHKLKNIKRSASKTYLLNFTQELMLNEFDQIILTTGSSKASLQLAASAGHKITELVPSLFSFEVADPRLVDLGGISWQNIDLQLSCGGKKFKQSGPVLITHWGFSGPATIKLSALAAKELHAADYQAELRLNLLPGHTQLQIFALLQQQRAAHPNKQLGNDNFLNLPKRYWHRLLELFCGEPNVIWQAISKKTLHKLSEELVCAKFKVSGKGVFKEEFVTCGGVPLTEVNFKTMESRISPGLHFAGEVLDVDGITGGYNFQAAWTTGWIAGRGAAGVQID